MFQKMPFSENTSQTLIYKEILENKLIDKLKGSFNKRELCDLSIRNEMNEGEVVHIQRSILSLQLPTFLSIFSAEIESSLSSPSSPSQSSVSSSSSSSSSYSASLHFPRMLVWKREPTKLGDPSTISFSSMEKFLEMITTGCVAVLLEDCIGMIKICIFYSLHDHIESCFDLLDGFISSRTIVRLWREISQLAKNLHLSLEQTFRDHCEAFIEKCWQFIDHHAHSLMNIEAEESDTMELTPEELQQIAKRDTLEISEAILARFLIRYIKQKGLDRPMSHRLLDCLRLELLSYKELSDILIPTGHFPFEVLFRSLDPECFKRHRKVAV